MDHVTRLLYRITHLRIMPLENVCSKVSEFDHHLSKSNHHDTRYEAEDHDRAHLVHGLLILPAISQRPGHQLQEAVEMVVSDRQDSMNFF